MDSHFVECLLNLYPEFERVYGPYLRKDGRQHVLLHTTINNRRTLSWPKAILEVKLGRRLVGSETTDHINDDFTDDSPENLQVLSRTANSEKPFITGLRDKNALANFGRTSSECQRRSLQMQGARNIRSQLSDDDATHLLHLHEGQRLTTKDRAQICQQYGCSDRALRNLLKHVSYSHLTPMAER